MYIPRLEISSVDILHLKFVDDKKTCQTEILSDTFILNCPLDKEYFVF